MRRTEVFVLGIIAFLIMTVSSAVAGPSTHTGVVLEALTAGDYTYMNIEEGANKFWIAGPRASVEKGARVSFSEQIWMNNFKSKALNRTFDKILFVDGVYDGSPQAISPAAPAQAPAAKKAAPAKPAKAAGTFTIKQIYAKKAKLKGKIVKVRGEVVKVSTNIMDRTWVHVKDGTGAEGSNKLIFRSVNDSAAVGDVVTAQGRLETDTDFGFGYFYPVIVEDATFSK